MKRKLFKWIFAIILFMPFIAVNAATANIKVSSSAGTVLVGNTFKVTVKVSSTTALGSVDYTLNYDTSKLKLVSGDSHIADYAKSSSVKAMTKTFSFKAISSGNPKISVKSYEVYAWSEASMSVSVTPVTIKTMTQAQLEATYSSNNNLSSLTVSPGSLSPSFDKGVLEYHVALEPDVEMITVSAKKAESHASIDGTGKIPVSEGDNKITITVTSQKGTKKTYTIIATVIDKNPIKAIISNEEYTVIKKSSMLEAPTTFELSEVTINEQKIPSLYSEITDYNLVGLKDSEGNIKLAIYNEKNETYTFYQELKFDSITFFPLKFLKPFNGYEKTNITINDIEVEGYKYKKNSPYTLLYGINIETGETHIYTYDEKENTLQIYNNDEANDLKAKINNCEFIIKALVAGLILEVFLIVLLLTKKSKRKNKDISLINNEKKKEKVKKEKKKKKKNTQTEPKKEELKVEEKTVIKTDEEKKESQEIKKS